jgi:hypothetical protein
LRAGAFVAAVFDRGASERTAGRTAGVRAAVFLVELLATDFRAGAFVTRRLDDFLAAFLVPERTEELAARRPLPAADFARRVGRLAADFLAPRDCDFLAPRDWPAAARLPLTLRPVTRPAFRFAIQMPLCLP